MFNGKFAEEGDNMVDNPYIYNVERDHRLSSNLQLMTSGSVLKFLFFQSGSVIVFSIPEIILLSSKQNVQVLNIFGLFQYIETVTYIAFI